MMRGEKRRGGKREGGRRGEGEGRRERKRREEIEETERGGETSYLNLIQEDPNGLLGSFFLRP